MECINNRQSAASNLTNEQLQVIRICTNNE